MRFVTITVSTMLLFICLSTAAQEEPQVPAAPEETQISKEFTKTYRAYNAAYSQRNFIRAAELARKTLDLAVSELGADHEKIPVLQVNLAHVLIITGEMDEAEPILLKAKAEMIRLLGADHPDLITVHEDHAKIYASRQELDNAHEELNRIIAIMTKQSGDKSPSIAMSWSSRRRSISPRRILTRARQLTSQRLPFMTRASARATCARRMSYPCWATST